MLTMCPPEEQPSLQTSATMLQRLKAGDDAESWNQFYAKYGKLIRNFALRAGLTEVEADEVTQETAIAVARHLPEFNYDPKVCRFKTWLLNQASWRVKDQLTRRRRNQRFADGSPGANGPVASSGEETRTATVETVPDPAAVDLDGLFEAEWRKTVAAVAIEVVKKKFTAKQFQIFDLVVLQEWRAAEVAKSLGVTLANVYVTKHRFAAALKKEVARQEQKLS
jgi:RNA polymerase sigma-70 factor (ECF subfamily)